MKKSINKKTIVRISIASVLLFIAILAFLEKVHIGIYNAY